MAAKKKATEKRVAKKDEPIRLDMTFEQAMKKALNTPLPKNRKINKKK